MPAVTCRRNAPADIVAYAYMFKTLEFPVPFERIEQPVQFASNAVSCFGIDEVSKPGQAGMYPQVLILDYESPADFVIELRTKSESDRVILSENQAEGNAL